MAISSLTTASNGDVLNFSTISTQLSTIRTWLNGGMIAGDIDDDEILRDHIVRPLLLGYPVEGMLGRIMQQYGFTDYGTSGPTRQAVDWVVKSDRLSFYPGLTADGVKWITPIGKTFYVPEQSFLYATFHGMIHTSEYSTNLAYGTDEIARLVILYCEHDDEDGDWIEINHSRYIVHAQINEPWQCHGFVTTLTGGSHYSVALGYVYDDSTAMTDPDNRQVDLREIHGVIEVYPQTNA